MSDKCCLDTSALLALVDSDNELETDRMYSLLERGEDGGLKLFFSFMTEYELLYLAQKTDKPIEWRKAVKDLAEMLVPDFSLERIECSDDILKKAAELKGGLKCSVCDSWIAACASLKDATLYHKDKEMDSLPIYRENISATPQV